MFSELLESVAVRKTTNKGWGVLVSAILQGACVAVLVSIPLIHMEALPKAALSTFLTEPPPPPDSPPTPATAVRPAQRRGIRIIEGGVMHAPRSIPPRVDMTLENERPPDDLTNGRVGEDTFRPDLLNSVRPAATGVTPPPPAPAKQCVQIGGSVEAAQIVEQPQPVYPTLALQIHLQGIVVLHAIIGRDGRVSELQLVSGHPLLVQAALDAVKRWRYRPTVLDGEPVEVETTITVSFVLAQ